jgi:hypothetical protein
VSNGLSLASLARSPDVAGPLCRKIASLMDRSFAAFILWTWETDGLERKRGPPAFPISTIRSGPPPPNGEAHTEGARRQDRSGQLPEKAPLAGQEAPRVESNLRTRETTFWRTTAEPPQRDSKGCLAGYQRFSKGVAERRDADLSVTQTLTTGFSKH